MESKTQLNGLTRGEVAKRMAEGKVNKDFTVKSKTVKRIIYENIFTLFNFLNFLLALALLFAGSYKNMLFMGVVVSNTAIGIIQEIRSKRAVDKLSIIVSKKAAVIREGMREEIDIEQIVLDDLICLKRGDQIPADCKVIDGSCTVNESLLTGESDLIHKTKGSKLFSGSFIVSGECKARVEKIGRDCYASQIHSEAKYIKKVKSEIMSSLNKILSFVSVVIIPIGLVLLWRQVSLAGAELSDAVVNVVAALIGMIPEGLILLTSTVLAVSVIRLSGKKVLVQEMYCIETLARVDVLCLDKTGTITADEMQVERLVTLGGADKKYALTVLATVGKSSNDDNSTILAVKKFVKDAQPLPVKKTVAFSSENKWSGAVLSNGKSIIIGAGEFINKAKYEQALKNIDFSIENYRVIALAESASEISENRLPADISFIALALISDKVREGAVETIGYFKEQGVQIKVISGDAPKTVSNIAKQAGIDGSENYIDATDLDTEEKLINAADRYTVFGRVTPQQKKSLIKALKSKGHTVAMTGDGVNDVLALKESDCSVAMAAGSEAARNVSQLVLVNNDFSSMPSVVAEGRRTINNIQRSASLFLVKTLFSAALAISFIFITMQYPFEPIQMSLISAFTIGIPSFVLALEPNHERVTGRFLKNVISRAVPAAVTVILNIYLTMLAGSVFSLEYAQISTIAVILTAVTEFMLICRISTPFTKIRAALFIFTTVGFTVCLLAFRELFSIARFDFKLILILAVLAAIAFLIFNAIYLALAKLNSKNKKDK